MSDYQFAADDGASTNLASDPKIASLASCIANQQRAGFKTLLDLRQASCPQCRAPGFNTGWGYFAFTCGAEVSGDEMMAPCSAPSPADLDAARRAHEQDWDAA